jgi:hypothetical protein
MTDGWGIFALGLAFLLAVHTCPPRGGWRAWWNRRPRWAAIKADVARGYAEGKAKAKERADTRQHPEQLRVIREELLRAAAIRRAGHQPAPEQAADYDETFYSMIAVRVARRLKREGLAP